MKKNAKALWITDLHLRPIHQDAGSRLLNFILEQIVKLKPDMLIITGDVFHDKNITYLTVMEMFRDFLKIAAKTCPIYMAPGNHDYGMEYSAHSLSGFKGMDNVHVVDTAYRITDKVGLVSYARREPRYRALMEELGPVEFLFGHFDINGFNLGSGWEEKESWSDPSMFAEYKTLKIVFSGHYHLWQEKIINDIKFIFLGSGSTTDFGESDQEKRIGLVDLETGELTSIPTGLTLHKTIRITVGDPWPEIPAEEVNAGVQFRVVVRGTQQQISLLEYPKDYPARVTYDFITESSDRLDVSATDKKEDVLKKFVDFECKKQGPVVEALNLNQERLLEMGNKIMAKVRRG